MSNICKFIPKGALRKRRVSDSDSDEGPVEIKRTARAMGKKLLSGTSVKNTKSDFGGFKADKSTKQTLTTKDNATAVIEIDTEHYRDEQSIFERIQQQKQEIDADDGLYHGIKFYDQKEYKDTIIGKASSGFNRKGPMRAPTNIRSTTRWDYQPDICKDYKETGFCGFGDSCKFLHDRSDYKFGWQLEQEEKLNQSDSDDEKYVIHDSDDDNNANVPLHCPYCRGKFKQPMVSKCKHYFCVECANAMCKKLKNRCGVCDADTEGKFTNADFILKEIDKIEEKRLKKGRKDGEEDKDSSSDSDL